MLGESVITCFPCLLVGLKFLRLSACIRLNPSSSKLVYCGVCTTAHSIIKQGWVNTCKQGSPRVPGGFPPATGTHAEGPRAVGQIGFLQQPRSGPARPPQAKAELWFSLCSKGTDVILHGKAAPGKLYCLPCHLSEENSLMCW